MSAVEVEGTAPAVEAESVSIPAETTSAPESWTETIASVAGDAQRIVNDQFEKGGALNTDNVSSIVSEMAEVPGELLSSLSTGTNEAYEAASTSAGELFTALSNGLSSLVDGTSFTEAPTTDAGPVKAPPASTSE
ncbi:hypothetical protein SARC_12604 [Sphaeroforma arctica JP610]|uniref:Uncharacterized protein n=1 Tax=Sphaeroforma arctica JP610 TaxID=667725 RepID=A0A0L0FDL3_9EUKA|nr:hypothetical protein SARC_12604 [Sphaeroforma arctica JP610]KNC74857.1 hypothetical protein SARC_12604 [Sphaeroforma arctica JP610]|eukprot:XP_014148759.1 hypothetical protein SARC_12604 [Sphaeroforma arctica JP610]